MEFEKRGTLGIVAFVVVIFGIMAFAMVAGVKAEQKFKKECRAVAGQVVTADDGDIECYRNGREIAELGENSPHAPKLNGDD